MADLLHSIGLQTKQFTSVSEFLEWKSQGDACCLILDVRLPGLSGLDFQSELNKSNIQIPIVFMTGHGDIPMTVRAMKGGAIDFLSKPFRDQDMLDAVQTAIEYDKKRRQSLTSISKLKSAFELANLSRTRNHGLCHGRFNEQTNRKRNRRQRSDREVSSWQLNAKNGGKVGRRGGSDGRGFGDPANFQIETYT